MTSDAETAGLAALLHHPHVLDELEPITDASDILAISSRLRAAGHSPELIAAALTQQRLRAKAATKFGAYAKDFLFTSSGLEQATRLDVAARHAARFRDAGCSRVADLGCGVGTESFALAGLGLDVLAVDADETHAALTLLNLRAFDSVTVLHSRIEDLAWEELGVDGIFADPARRDARGRRLAPDLWSPLLATILELRRVTPNVGIKVAPGIPYEQLPADSHVQWTSVDGALVEASIWCGKLAPEGPGRSALVIDSTAGAACYEAPVSAPHAAATEVAPRPLARYVHEADPAILRSGALATIADRLDAGLVSPRISYLTSDSAPALAGVTSFEVLDVLPAKAKALADELQRRDIGAVEILKRGMDISPDDFRRRLKLRGSQRATLIMTRIADRHSALLVARVEGE